MRKSNGFSIITTVAVIVMVAFIASMMISVSSTSVKQTQRQYLKAQAKLLINSSIEYTLLAISGHPDTTNCITNILLKFPNDTIKYTHEANITIKYIANTNTMPKCGAVEHNSTSIVQESDKTVLLDVSVRVNPALTSEEIRVHKRSLQKI